MIGNVFWLLFAASISLTLGRVSGTPKVCSTFVTIMLLSSRSGFFPALAELPAGCFSNFTWPVNGDILLLSVSAKFCSQLSCGCVSSPLYSSINVSGAGDNSLCQVSFVISSVSAFRSVLSQFSGCPISSLLSISRQNGHIASFAIYSFSSVSPFLLVSSLLAICSHWCLFHLLS